MIAMPNMRPMFDFYCASSGWNAQFGEMTNTHSGTALQLEPRSQNAAPQNANRTKLETNMGIMRTKRQNTDDLFLFK